eukprot:4200941-Amphidinium_carterae.1
MNRFSATSRIKARTQMGNQAQEYSPKNNDNGRRISIRRMLLLQFVSKSLLLLRAGTVIAAGEE